jgi:hypothetical protein
MSTTENGNQFHIDPTPDLPALPEVRQTAASRSAPTPTHLTTERTAVEQPDLAAADRERRSRRRADALLIGADYRTKDWVPHPDGGKVTAEEAQQEAIAERARIENDTKQGSRKHLRVPGWLRHVPRLVLLFDFFLLLYFFAGITDVNWQSPLSANLAFAILLAAMVTVLSYGFLSFTGHRMRTHKDHSGAVPIGELDFLSKTAVAAALLVIAILATLMFTRMRTEVIYALGPASGSAALVIALTLAVVSVAANLLVVGIHAHDGSDQVERLNKLSAAAYRRLAKAHRLRERAARQAGQ